MRLLIPLLAAAVLSLPATARGDPASALALSALDARADTGDARAQTALAVRYEYAEGVPKDLRRTYRLLCAAAKNGYAEAQFQLGWLYANGRGVTHDDAVAAALFALAAKQGHVYAAKMLRFVSTTPTTQLPRCMRPARAVASGDEQGETVGGRAKIAALVYRLAPRFGVDPKLALAVIAVESGYDKAAVSPKNAQGLMQLIPATAKRFRVADAFDAAQNVKGGLAYLRWLLAYFRGDVALVLAGYNAGEAAVDKYGGIPPYAETRAYVRKVEQLYKKVRANYQPEIVAPSPAVRVTSRVGR